MEYSPYFDPLLETLSREEITALQLQRLRSTVEHCMHSPFYAERLKQCGVSADSIKSLDDLKRIPFTTKQYLSLRHCLGKARRMRAFAFVERHHRQSHRDTSHAEGPERMGCCRGSLSVDGGLASV